MIWEVISYIIIFYGLVFSIFLLITLSENEEKVLKSEEPKKYPKVSIIVPAYNEADNIANTIENLLKLDYPKDKLEIIVVDDGSKDNTYEIAKKYEKYGVKVFRKENGGKASALNYGFLRSTGEIIVSLDADSYPERNALKNLVKYFDDPEVMAVTPSVKVENPKNFVQLLQYFEYAFSVTLRKIFGLLDAIYVTPGPFSAYRREFLERYGLFDENNITEDLEMGLRIQKYGFKIRNAIDAVVYTKAPDTFKKLMRQRLRWYLGFIENIINYRHLIGRPDNLGRIILPSAVFYAITPAILSLTLIVSYSMTFFDYSRIFFRDPSVVFLAPVFIPNFLLSLIPSIDMNLFGVVSIIGVCISSIFIIFGENLTRGDKKILLALPIYFIIWGFLYGIFWLNAFLYKLFGRELRWGEKLRWRNSIINKLLHKNEV